MNINLHTWYTERRMSFCPKHFVPVSASIDDEKILWVYEKTTGRFYIKEVDFLSTNHEKIYFEDPKEAILFNLTWS